MNYDDWLWVEEIGLRVYKGNYYNEFFDKY